MTTTEDARQVGEGMPETNILSMAETQRFIIELVRSIGSDGMTRDDLEAAHDEFHDMLVVSGLVWAWLHRKLSVAWDSSSRELRFSPFVADEELFAYLADEEARS